MKVACLLNGQPRFTDYFFDFVSYKLPREISVDWFIYLWNQKSTDDSRIPTWWDENPHKIINILTDLSHRVIDFTVADFSTYDTTFDTFQHKRPESIPRNIWYMFKSLYEAGKNLQASTEYDLVIKIRSDLTTDKVLNYDTCLNFIKKNPNTIITSNYHTFGFNVKEINDWFAIGDHKCMSTYTKVFPNLKKYCQVGIIQHPESLLASHLILNDIDWIYSNIINKLTGKN